MVSVELVLAVIATADLCLKYGKILVDQYSSFRGADTEIDERILKIAAFWKRTEIQIEFYKKIWEQLDGDHQVLLNQTMLVLQSKLEKATAKIVKVEKRKIKETKGGEEVEVVVGHKKVKYAFWLKESLDKAIDDMESWQKMFDPSWFLIMKVPSSLIDAELGVVDGVEQSHAHLHSHREPSMRAAQGIRKTLRNGSEKEQKGIFMPDKKVIEARADKRVVDLPHSCAQIMIDQSNDASKLKILDRIVCDPEANVSILKKDVRDLATKLSRTEAVSFGLLTCRGAIQESNPDNPKKVTSFTLVFNLPDALSVPPNPRSLRSVLLSTPTSISLSLSTRFTLARQLATSISFVHTISFVHKSVRPENILLIDLAPTKQTSFLLGFEKFRTAHGRTIRSNDCAWEKDLYRHPSRQGLKPEEDYAMQHDIYSLGVCLLELGLWESFVTFTSPDSPAYPSPRLATALGPSWHPKTAKLVAPGDVKTALIALARSELPAIMGDLYTDIVVTCLTCLDAEGGFFGDESEREEAGFVDQDGVEVGVRYIEVVLMRLSEISI